MARSALWQTLFEQIVLDSSEGAGHASGKQGLGQAKEEPQTPPRNKKRSLTLQALIYAPPSTKKPAAPTRVGAARKAPAFSRPAPESLVLRQPGKRSQDGANMFEPEEVPAAKKAKEQVDDADERAVCEVQGDFQEPKYRRSCKKRVKSEHEQKLAALKKHLAQMGGAYPLWQRLHRMCFGCITHHQAHVRTHMQSKQPQMVPN